MATRDAPDLGGLTMSFAGVSLPEAASFHEDAFPALNPVDLFRCFISEELSRISGVDRKLIYPALSWTNALEKGDLLLAVPQLRLKGTPPTEKAQELAKEVIQVYSTKRWLYDGTNLSNSSHKTSCSIILKPLAFLYDLNLIRRC
jgi:hypothetical protein